MLALTLLLVLALALAGCGGSKQERERPGSGGRAGEGGSVATTAGRSGLAPAFAGVDEAGRVAEEWQPDARLYAIANLAPVDAGGRSEGWLYSYVSPEAGTVLGVSVSGGEARRQPEQGLTRADVENIARNALPDPEGERLLDSPEAMAAPEAAEVRRAVEGRDGAESAAGLDSFSGGEPAWILSALDPSGRRIEARVPAERGG